MQALSHGDYTQSELTFLFECKEGTVARHVNQECQHSHNSRFENPSKPYEDYTDDELLAAYRRVYRRQGREKIGNHVYDKHRRSSEPASSTIIDRFGTWPEARRLAHKDA